MMDLSPKVYAYLRASEVVKRARAERNMYDRKTAAAINQELKSIGARLTKSAQKIYNNELLKAALDKDPNTARNYADWKKLRRYLNAQKTIDRITADVEKQRENEPK